jgi:hypothetical protein
MASLHRHTYGWETGSEGRVRKMKEKIEEDGGPAGQRHALREKTFHMGNQ